MLRYLYTVYSVDTQMLIRDTQSPISVCGRAELTRTSGVVCNDVLYVSAQARSSYSTYTGVGQVENWAWFWTFILDHACSEYGCKFSVQQVSYPWQWDTHMYNTFVETTLPYCSAWLTLIIFVIMTLWDNDLIRTVSLVCTVIIRLKV